MPTPKKRKVSNFATILVLCLSSSHALPDYSSEYASASVKGPCPALNTLSNHGILPRDGRNIPTLDILRKLEETFSLTGVEVILDALDDLSYINGNGTKVIDYELLWDSDTDSSLVHEDLYFDPTGSPSSALLDGLEGAAGNDGVLTLEELADWRDLRIKDSLERNPEFEYNKRNIFSSSFDSVFIFYAFGSDPLVNTASIKDVMTFLRDNRFPVNFVPRSERGEKVRNIWKDPLLNSIHTFFEDRTKSTLPKIVDTDEAPTAQQCVYAFNSLQFDIFDYDRYDEYFHEDSKVILSQAGIYEGPSNIEEYMRFADVSSPYIRDREYVYKQFMFKTVDKRNAICTFQLYTVTKFETDPTYAKETTFLLASLYKVNFDFQQNYITEARLHLENDYIDFMMEDVFMTPQIVDFICDVSDRCLDTNQGMTREECTLRLQELQATTNSAIDGRDYGCRVLHAVFAAKNPDHCPHISFDPQEDPHGKTKCQFSSNYSSSDFFDADEIEDWHDWLSEKKSMIENVQGYKILEKPKETHQTRQLVLGLAAPLIIFVAIFCSDYNSRTKAKLSSNKLTTEQPLNPGHALLANKARQLWILIMMIMFSLFVVNGLVIGVLYLIEGNKDWEESRLWEDDDSDLTDNYRGRPNVVADTVPQELLTDEQFAVFSGFIVWITAYLSGLGIEVFVWYRFLQTWCEEREIMWRFVQFIFPLMLVTALGLSTHRNFLALPVLVIGLWKFGFPETLMYLYLGTWSKHQKGLKRASDLINGVGTAVHHGAASMIVSMLVVGVIPSSRYVLNNTLILVMQHWIVLLTYGNKSLYTALVIVMEYYFEWVIFSDFAEIYYLHWTAAWGAGAMICAHWLYLAAAVLARFVDDETPELASQDAETDDDLRNKSDAHDSNGLECWHETSSSTIHRQRPPGTRRRSSSSLQLADEFLHAQQHEFRRVSDTFDESQALGIKNSSQIFSCLSIEETTEGGGHRLQESKPYKALTHKT